MLLSWADSGSTRKALTKKMIESFEVSAPADVDEQRAIAHILGTLDDKIELNRRMNETLEEMARALFKSWFVDFDPVRAKMEGRWRRGESLPGMPAELYDLFPDGMVDSELGEIPAGWEVKGLGDLCQKLEYGYTATAQDTTRALSFCVSQIFKKRLDRLEFCALLPRLPKETMHDLLSYSLTCQLPRMADPGHGVG